MAKYEPTTKYLAVKGWDKIKAGKDRKGRQIRAWHKEDNNKDFDDPAYSSLTLFQRGLFDAILRACGRTGSHLIHNDVTHVIRATCTRGTDAPHVGYTLSKLIARGLLIPTNQQRESSESETQSETETETETKTSSAARAAAVVSLSPRDKDNTNPSGPITESQKQTQPQQPLKPCGCEDGLCDWVSPLEGCDYPQAVGDAVYFQRHVKKNDYFIKRLNKGYLVQEWKRILADTPEDYAYDHDPMIKESTIHVDGGPAIRRYVSRRPKNAKERALLLKDPDRNRLWLYNPACPNHCKEGLVFVSDNPDAELPIQRRIGHDEYCPCVVSEECYE